MPSIYQCDHLVRRIINSRKRQKTHGRNIQTVYRRYECQDPKCWVRWTTYEISEQDLLKVLPIISKRKTTES